MPSLSSAMSGVSVKSFMSAWLWWAIALVSIIFDQVTKIAADTGLSYNEPLPITWFFNLTLRYNTGAAFSFLADASGWQRWFFLIISSAVSVLLLWWITRANFQNKKLECLGLALILGGAIGNLYDRMVYGHVIDFLEFHYKGWYFPAFNIADSCICVGAGFLLLDMVLAGKKQNG